MKLGPRPFIIKERLKSGPGKIGKGLLELTLWYLKFIDYNLQTTITTLVRLKARPSEI